MRRHVSLLTFIIMSFSMALGQSEQHTSRAKHLVEIIRQKTKDTPVSTWPDPQSDIAGDLERVPEYAELQTLMESHWQSALDNVESVAPDKQSRAILLHSFENLSPERYLLSANQSLDLFASKRIGDDELLYGVLLPPTKKRWFWSYNYQDIGVVAFLDRVRTTFPNEPRIAELIRFILSGEARERDERLRKESRHLAKQEIQLLTSNMAPPPRAVSATPLPSTPVLAAAPLASPAPATPVGHAPAVAAERKSPVWPWVVGIFALIMIVAVALKRRA